jgi:hypothetical protein
MLYLAEYVNRRRYFASHKVNRDRRGGKAQVDRALKRSRSLPRRLRGLAQEMYADPRPLYRFPVPVQFLWDQTYRDLVDLADSLESLGKEYEPRTRDAGTPLRRRDYTGLIDDVLRDVKSATGRPHIREVYMLLCAVCERAGITAPQFDSVIKHHYRSGR